MGMPEPCKDKVPFASEGVMFGNMDDSENWTPEQFSFIEAWQNHMNAECERDWADLIKGETVDPLTPTPFNGWMFGTESECGVKKNVYGYTMTKPDTNFKVILLNEDQYSSVGSLTLTVVGDDEASVQEFLNDFKDILQAINPIETDHPVVVFI